LRYGKECGRVKVLGSKGKGVELVLLAANLLVFFGLFVLFIPDAAKATPDAKLRSKAGKIKAWGLGAKTYVGVTAMIAGYLIYLWQIILILSS